MSEDIVKVWQEGSAGRIRLNRPAALNALTLDMVRLIDAALSRFEQDGGIALLILDAEGPRAFCAGGDVRALYESAQSGDGQAETFWREEYRLDARIAAYPKPIIAFMDGIVMGGGVGISAHASHRIVTEKTGLAMPEVGIGFIPDVGGSFLLAQSPSHFGRFMALTGDRIGASDIIAAGFADAMVERGRLAELSAALGQIEPGPETSDRVFGCLAKYAVAAPAGLFAAHQMAISRLFAADTVEGILDALDAEASEFAIKTAETIHLRSPTSLKLALRLQLDPEARASLAGALRVEFRVAMRLLVHGEFHEGVRAAIIDKDHKPVWAPASPDQVLDADLDFYFASLGEGDLSLS